MSANVVVTDMDETLISKKSTGYIIRFMFAYRSFLRIIFLLPPLFPILKILSLINSRTRTLAVKLMYWFAFRGIRVDKARRIAEEHLSSLYVRDLQDPVASAILAADDAVVITASPTFMARPWLNKYLNVPEGNVYGADLAERNGRFTGVAASIPIGETKVQLLKASVAATPGAVTTGYGDHPTDVPFLKACDRGVLVHPLPEAVAAGCEYEPARSFDLGKLPTAPASP